MAGWRGWLLGWAVVGTACSAAPVGGGDGTSSYGGTAGSGGGAAATGSGGTGAQGAGGTLGTGGTLSTGCATPCTAPDECAPSGTCLPPGACAADVDCDAGQVCDVARATCTAGGGCGAQALDATAVPPNLLIEFDRSCSMRRLVGGVSKWELAVTAINAATTSQAGKIHWGLNLFPDKTGDECLQETSQVPLGAGTEAAIQSLLTASLATTDPWYPSGPCVTNIDTAMLQASSDAELMAGTRAGYVLLLTDGRQAGCSAAGSDAGTEQIITALAAGGIKTFVVGFGDEVDPAQLNRFADLGGAPRNDPTTHYYQADDAATLEAALGAIAGSIVGCSFVLDALPPDPSQLYVFFDDQGVPRGSADGWTYDPATGAIEFTGAACQALRDGQVADVDIVFGCAEPVPE